MHEPLSWPARLRRVAVVAGIFLAMLTLTSGRFCFQWAAVRLDYGVLSIIGTPMFPGWATGRWVTPHAFALDRTVLPHTQMLPAPGWLTATPLVSVPVAPWLVIYAILVFFPFGMLLRSSRSRTFGGCLECGYDLVGWHQPRCPECGVLVPPDYLAAIRHSRRRRRHLRGRPADVAPSAHAPVRTRKVH